MAKEFTIEDDELLADLGVEVEVKKPITHTARQERIIAGFEEIQRFVEDNKRVPQHGEEQDIFERLYAVRLDQIRKLEECTELLKSMDHQGLLDEDLSDGVLNVETLDDDELLSALGVEDETDSITELKYVRSSAEKRAVEEVANREKCTDFEIFKPLFEKIQIEIDQAVRVTRPIRKDAGFLKTDIAKGQFFILGGQTAYVAAVGDEFKAPNGESDARLRVIYSNGTESNLLLRSLQRALYKDETSRRVSDPTHGPLFSGQAEEEDLASGTVYVLRSLSDNPSVTANRDLLHKIGVTGGSVEKRLANASKDPTFLMADVEVVATYSLFNINRTKFEHLIHRVFDQACMDIDIIDRFGSPVAPREWFLVPLFVIDEVIEKFKDGTIGDYVYNPNKAALEAVS